MESNPSPWYLIINLDIQEPQMTDNERLQRLFEQCVEHHADSMYRVAYRLMGCRELARELVQETYLQAWKNMRSLENPEKIKSWMFAIMRYQYTKLLRRLSKMRQLTTLQMEELTASHDVDDSGGGPDMIRTALEQLSDEHRLPLLLVSMEGMTVQEAAEVLDVPRGTVLSRLHRGRNKLKTILSRANPDWAESAVSRGSELK